jgi:cell division transport system permease protein
MIRKDPRKRSRSNSSGQQERRKNEAQGALQSTIGLKDRISSYFSNHCDVASTSFKRMLAAPLVNIMTWAVIAIAIALPVGLFVFLQNVQQLSSGWDNVVQISVYLKPDVSSVRAQALSRKWQQNPDIERVQYISPEQALNEFQQLSGFGEALSYLDENPLPAVIVVHPKTEDSSLLTTKTLLATLQMQPEVEQAKLDLEWVQRLYGIMNLAQRSVIALGFLLSLAVLLVIGNTIRLAIEARRDEIVVVKLVGGTDAFVRRPFLYTGIWYGLGGGIGAWLIINSLLLWLSGPVSSLVGAYSSQFSLSGLGFLDTLALFLVSAALGLTGAWLAVGRHLSSIEPR